VCVVGGICFLTKLFFFSLFSCFVCTDMVEPAVVQNPEQDIYSVDVAEYFVPKDKNTYEDREEMIN